MPIQVKKDIQLAVDQYLALYAECKKLEDEMGELRDVIKPYMEANGLPDIDGSDGTAKVVLTKQERPVMNARYTSYDVEEISKLLTPALRKKCIVEVVDKERLEGLQKLGEIPEEVLTKKITKTSSTFSVKAMK